MTVLQRKASMQQNAFLLVPAIKGDMYITHCNYSQPASIKLDNENIGGHLTPLQSNSTLARETARANVDTVEALCIRRTRTADGGRTRTLCIRRTPCRHVTIGTPMVIFAVLTVTVFGLFLTVFDDWYTVGAVLVDM